MGIMVRSKFFTDPLDCFAYIRDRFGDNILHDGDRLLAAFDDLCPRLRSERAGIRYICKSDLLDNISKSDRNSLKLVTDRLVAETIVNEDTASKLYVALAYAFDIDISTPQIKVIKSVTAQSPKRFDTTLSGKFSQSAFADPVGKLYTWGMNEFGSTGVGDDAPVRFPTQIAVGIKSVSMGWSHSLALKFDGTLLGFGENRFGGLGPDAHEECFAPVPIMHGIAFTDCGGRMHSYAVKFDGSLINIRGLKVGTETILTDTVSVSAGMLHSLAVKSDGTLWGWGENRFGQLGDGTKLTRKTPVFIMNDVVFAAAGTYHSIAIKSDKTLWTWGLIPDLHHDNGSSQSEISVPTPVLFMSDVKTAAAGELHSLAVKTDGTLWAWGKNFYGQLGDKTDVNRKIPVQIMENVEEVTAGVRYSMCKKDDGSIWAWGLNESYQLGDGTDINRNSPLQIKIN
jgi:alpha-tubulin suppressor-like RCC1 family protein